MKLYMAGALFSTGEIAFNESLALKLRMCGYECFLPQEIEANLRFISAAAIFKGDVDGMDWADMIVANIDGPDPDSGTSWELGYMHAKGKPAILYRTDFRTACGDIEGSAVNLMLTVPAFKTLLLPKATPLQVCMALDAVIVEYQHNGAKTL